MYDIRQFKPALYALLLLGITGFGIAIVAPGLWLLAVALVLLNAGLVATNRFRSIPRLVANLITIFAGVWSGMRVAAGEVPVVPVGVFLIVLQVVKLYEQRGNRDFGQLIVLSLLTMVAAAMTHGGTAFLFGMLFLVWVVLSLYTCLLFHLKVEADATARALHLRDDRPADIRRLRHDQRRLGSSMRRLTATVAVAAAGCAVVVFLLFPRGTGASLLSVSKFDRSQAVTGFSGTVSFQDIARIQQNTDPIAHLSLFRNGEPLMPGHQLYLRGNTLDVYESDPAKADRWTWRRSQLASIYERRDAIPDRAMPLGLATDPDSISVDNLIEQRIELEPTGVETLFALAGAFAISIERQSRIPGVGYYPSDGTMRSPGRPVTRRVRYTVWSTETLPGPVAPPLPLFGPEEGTAGHEVFEAQQWGSSDFPLDTFTQIRERVEALRLMTAGYAAGGESREQIRELREKSDEERAAWVFNRLGVSLPPGWETAPPENYATLIRQSTQSLTKDSPRPAADDLLEFVLDPRVAGYDDDGLPLIEKRLAMAGTTEWDELIARNMETYLRARYRYSLDVSAAAADLPPDRDPLAWFVSDAGREGHCEFFAGTMAIACQSIGIPARLVVGFKTNEFNTSIDRFTVRHSDAHAWVEVLTQSGWTRFDPTSNTSVDDASKDAAGGWAALGKKLRHWTEFLEYSWSNHIVAFDRGRQEGVQRSFFEEIDRSMDGVDESGEGEGLWQRVRSGAHEQTLGRLHELRQWFERHNLPGLLARIIAVVIVLLPLVAIGLTLMYLAGRWRLRRRARRIGLDGLAPEERQQMARQLGFYASMLIALDRRGIRRREHQTPREFAYSLSFLPPRSYEAVGVLTEAFYRVRYGRERVDAERRKQLMKTLDALS